MAIVAMLPAMAGAQTLGQADTVDIPIWRVVASLGLCLALALVAALALKRRLRGGLPTSLRGRERRLELIESIRLSHQVDLCLVRCDGEELLVATSPRGAQFSDRSGRSHSAENPL